jgi:hypothetical protein
MGKREYPFVGQVSDMRSRWSIRAGSDKGKPVKNRPRCCVCGEQADAIVWIQTNWFRGDDVSVRACMQHANDVDSLTSTDEFNQEMSK